MFLLICTTFSCGTPQPEPESDLVGEYEYIDESDGKVYEAQIISNSTGLSWIGPGVGMVPITEFSDLTFRISQFEIWGYITTIEGEFQGKELHITQEAFELQDIDLETPIIISNRIYIRK